jgi:hypothetical protein
MVNNSNEHHMCRLHATRKEREAICRDELECETIYEHLIFFLRGCEGALEIPLFGVRSFENTFSVLRCLGGYILSCSLLLQLCAVSTRRGVAMFRCQA